MKSFRPIFNRLRRAAGGTASDFFALAEDRWEVAPGGDADFPAAVFLPGQLDRIQATVFGNEAETRHALTYAGVQPVRPTTAFRFRDVDLVDGVLYKAGAEFHLRPRRRRLPLAPRPPIALSGAIYDSWVGLRYFGNWLMDDCETYRLAEAAGQPVTHRQDSSGHRADYEVLLGIHPQRVGDAHFDELILLDDMQNNAGRKARAADRRQRLAGAGTPDLHPGVFLLRSTTGDARLLRNEMHLAETLERRHSIRPMMAERMTVAEIVAACAGARVAVGVEGSQMTHALAAMPPGGTFLALFPPDRVTAAMKIMTDRLDLRFAVVVGEGNTQGFEISADEVESTLAMLG
jgi:Glycosyltransferase 61